MKKSLAILIMCGLFFGHMAQAMYGGYSSYFSNIGQQAAARLAAARSAISQGASNAWQPFARRYSTLFSSPKSLSTNPAFYSTLKAPSPYGTTNMAQFSAPRFANFTLQSPAVANARPLSTSTPTRGGDNMLGDFLGLLFGGPRKDWYTIQYEERAHPILEDIKKAVTGDKPVNPMQFIKFSLKEAAEYDEIFKNTTHSEFWT